MFGLLGAYAAISSQHLCTSIYVFALVIALVIFLPVAFLVRHNCQGDPRSQGPLQDQGHLKMPATARANQ